MNIDNSSIIACREEGADAEVVPERRPSPKIQVFKDAVIWEQIGSSRRGWGLNGGGAFSRNKSRDVELELNPGPKRELE